MRKTLISSLHTDLSWFLLSLIFVWIWFAPPSLLSWKLGVWFQISFLTHIWAAFCPKHCLHPVIQGHMSSGAIHPWAMLKLFSSLLWPEQLEGGFVLAHVTEGITEFTGTGYAAGQVRKQKAQNAAANGFLLFTLIYGMMPLTFRFPFPLVKPHWRHFIAVPEVRLLGDSKSLQLIKKNSCHSLLLRLYATRDSPAGFLWCVVLCRLKGRDCQAR